MKRILLIFLVALFLGTLFRQDFLWQRMFAPPDKVMAPIQSSRTFLGDDYYYYIISKKAPLRLAEAISPSSDGTPKRQNFFYENSGLENIYRGALVLAGSIDRIAQSVPLAWNLQLALSLILQLSFLMTGLLVTYAVLRNRPRIPWIELVLFGFLWAFFSNGVMLSIYAAHPGALVLPALNYYPNFLRLVNPQMGWAYGFFYLALLIGWLQRPTRAKYSILIAMSLLIGTVSISLLLTLILGLGFYGIAHLLRYKKLHFPLLGIGVALLVSYAYTQHQMDLFYLAEKGQNLQTGKFIGLHLKPLYFLPLIFLPLIRDSLPTQSKSPLSWLYFAGLFLGCISGCFELGDRLFVRGGGAFVWFLLLYGMSEWCRATFYQRWNAWKSRRHVPVLLCAGLVAWAGFALSISIGGWFNYIEKDKAEVIDWLRTHATRDDVIGSADLEDAYLIPLYTHSQPYVQLGDYGVHSEEKTLRHYLEMLDLMGLKHRYLDDIAAYTDPDHIAMINAIRKRPDIRVPYDAYQIYTFYGALVYYPYTQSTKNIFDSPENHAAFVRSIRAAAVAASGKNADVDYVVFKQDAGMTKPAGYRARFSNPSYQILAPSRL